MWRLESGSRPIISGREMRTGDSRYVRLVYAGMVEGELMGVFIRTGRLQDRLLGQELTRQALDDQPLTRFCLAPDPDRPLTAIPATRDSPPCSRDFSFLRLSPPATSRSRDFPLPRLHSSATFPAGPPATSPSRLYRSFLSCVLPHSSHATQILNRPTTSSPLGRISLTTSSGLRSFRPYPHVTASHFYFSHCRT